MVRRPVIDFQGRRDGAVVCDHKSRTRNTAESTHNIRCSWEGRKISSLTVRRSKSSHLMVKAFQIRMLAEPNVAQQSTHQSPSAHQTFLRSAQHLNPSLDLERSLQIPPIPSLGISSPTCSPRQVPLPPPLLRITRRERWTRLEP